MSTPLNPPTPEWAALCERDGQNIWSHMAGARAAVIGKISQQLEKDGSLKLVRLVPVNVLALLECNGFSEEGADSDAPEKCLWVHPAVCFFSVKKDASFLEVAAAIYDAGHTSGRRKIVNAWAQLQAALRLCPHC